MYAIKWGAPQSFCFQDAQALRKDHLCGIGVIPHLASCRKIQDNSVCGHVLLRKYIHFGCMAIALHSMTCWITSTPKPRAQALRLKASLGPLQLYGPAGPAGDTIAMAVI